jgi:hypothetical protein
MLYWNFLGKFNLLKHKIFLVSEIDDRKQDEDVQSLFKFGSFASSKSSPHQCWLQ